MKQDLSELLFNALNEQGYLFQEACEHTLKDAEGTTKWEVRASEYPVSLQGNDTKIDIVLRSNTSSSPELYALVECKRADPSYVHWVFGAPGLPNGEALCSTVGRECNQARSDQPYQINPVLKHLHFRVWTYDAKNWLETKAKRGSDGHTSSPQNIENAFRQILTGIGGFAREQVEQRRKTRSVFSVFFVPIVITTASLYVAHYEPKDIDISNGKISKEKVLFGAYGQPAEEVEWVLVDYGAGENVDPNPIPESYHGVDPAELQKHKIRSIFVVNSKAIQDFFSKLSLVGQS